MSVRFVLALAAVALGAAGGAQAKDWHEIPSPSAGPARVFGGPAAGCIAGAARLPTDGPGFQAIRVQRNRHYGHPDVVAFVQRLGGNSLGAGLEPFYVGDMAQPRGGPMNSGHGSHQTGLDVDIWFNLDPKPMLVAAERTDPPLPSMVRADQKSVSPAFGANQVALLKLAATDARVDRIFVHWTIKRALCERVAAPERDWLRRVRPWYGHMEHFHVRLSCPADSPQCAGQAAVPPGDGCDSTLAWWFDQHANRVTAPAPPPATAAKPPRPKLPAQCTALLR